jgi:tetratricopeptide (TPR) repeat protein
VAWSLNNLALLLQATNRLAEAEPLMQQALAIAEASYGTDHPEVAIKLNNLAGLLQVTNRVAEAESLSAQAVRILTASLGLNHPKSQKAREKYFKILQKLDLPDIEIQAKLDTLDKLGKH